MLRGTVALFAVMTVAFASSPPTEQVMLRITTEYDRDAGSQTGVDVYLKFEDGSEEKAAAGVTTTKGSTREVPAWTTQPAEVVVGIRLVALGTDDMKVELVEIEVGKIWRQWPREGTEGDEEYSAILGGAGNLHDALFSRPETYNGLMPTTCFANDAYRNIVNGGRAWPDARESRVHNVPTSLRYRQVVYPSYHSGSRTAQLHCAWQGIGQAGCYAYVLTYDNTPCGPSCPHTDGGVEASLQAEGWQRDTCGLSFTLHDELGEHHGMAIYTREIPIDRSVEINVGEDAEFLAWGIAATHVVCAPLDEDECAAQSRWCHWDYSIEACARNICDAPRPPTPCSCPDDERETLLPIVRK